MQMDGVNCVSMNHHTCFDHVNECKKKLTNLESLTDDLLFSILLVVPAQDIQDNARLVCLKWYCMIHTRNFTYAHLQQTTCGLLVRDMVDHQPRTTFVAMRRGRIEMSKFSYNFRHGVRRSCNGLIVEWEWKNKDTLSLFYCKSCDKATFGSPTFFCHAMPCRASCSLGYAVASMEYKVVVAYASSQGGNAIVLRCAILTVGVDHSWRHVDIQHLSDTTKKHMYRPPVITEGFIHWYGNGTLTLNVETEIITHTLVPQVGGVLTKKYCLAAGKHLPLLIHCSELSWEVWEMKRETGEWRKLPNIELEAQKCTLERFGFNYNTLVPVGWFIWFTKRC